MAEETVTLGDYYQHNYKSGNLNGYATFIWNIDRTTVTTDEEHTLQFRIQGENVHKVLVVGRNGRVKNHKQIEPNTYQCQFAVGEQPQGAVVKYWLPLYEGKWRIKKDLDQQHTFTEEWV